MQIYLHNFTSLESTTNAVRTGHGLVQVFINIFPVTWIKKLEKKLTNISISAWLANKVERMLFFVGFFVTGNLGIFLIDCKSIHYTHIQQSLSAVMSTF